MKCRNCGNDLLDTRQKFCSINCQDDYISNLEKMIVDATKNDVSHIQNLSKK
jgi:hypothetical protein